MKGKKIRDINGGANERTVVLRERVFRMQFEISRTKIITFLRDHKRWTIAMCAVLAVGVFARLFLIGFASTADFYPSSCLGSWENVQNALAGPDLSPGSPASAFTPLNSAVFSTGTAQMFCGNFSGKTDIADLQTKPLQSATLVLSWYAVFPEAALIGGGTPSDGSAIASTTTPSSSAPDDASTTTSFTATSTASSTPNAPDDGSTTTVSAPETTSSTAPDAGTDATTSATTPAPAPPPASDSAPAPDTTVAPSAPPADAAPSPDTSPSSWLFRLLPVAFAQDVASGTPLVASSAIEDVPSTSTATTSIAVDTSMFQNIPLPAAAPGDFLAIVYSTDGVTWQPLVDINADNWQTGRYAIPVTSWDELRHLQVAFVGLNASETPQIYLDSVGIEVDYLDEQDPAAAPSSDMSMGTSTVFETPSSTTSTSTDASSTADPLALVFDPSAGQQCSVSPFSNTTGHPGSASYILAMQPPSAPSIKSQPAPTNDSSTAMGDRTPITAAPAATAPPSVLPGPPLYDASLGSLPDGVNGYVTMSGTTGVDTIGLTVGPSAAPGSYGVIVIYKERQFDGKTLPTFCQFNLVIH